METLAINALLKDSPVPIAVLDKNITFQTYSKVWLEEFCPEYSDVTGKNLFKVSEDLPSEFPEILADCLEGKSSEHDGKKIITKDGAFKWLKWKANPFRNENNEISGIVLYLEDVTDESRRQELRQKAIEVARIGGWEIDLLTGELFWTDITKEIHEVPMDFVPDVTQGINFYKEGRHRDTISKIVAKAMNEGVPWDIELIIVTAKGKELWVRAMGDVEMFNGKCIRIFGTFQDIDAEKRIELKFNEVSKRLAIATSGSNIGIWEHDIETNQVVWDENMYRLYGVKRKTFDPNNLNQWQSILHPEDLESIFKSHNDAIQGKKDYETEFRIIRPNGKQKHIGAKAVLIKDDSGKPVKMVGTNIDITELTKTRLLLEKSEESFQGAFEKSNTGMALIDTKGNWIKVNKSLCNSLGYSEEELFKMTFQEITHPDDLDKDLLLLDKVLDGDKESYQIDKRYFHKKGHIVYGVLTVTAVRDIDGKLAHLISQVIDITERKNAEVELTRLVDITKHQNESLLNFAHIVSHNLRSHATNLSMLTGFLEGEKDEEEISDIHGMLSDAAESLNETVLHLNEVVQLKVGATQKLKPVNIYSTLKNVKKNLSVLIQEKNVKCITKVPEDLIVMGIPAYIDSIFLNLITNSIKYSSPDREPELTITSKTLNKNVILSFTDNGLGINLKRHGKKIFGMYKTFHKNKDAKGIGLFITKNQIEAMNGKIEVESTVDQGTTFKLYFELNQTA
ncbi:PAS domain S-box protein [Pseudozobellia sp. WGM2]|uniref:PAS domain-containing sensor histidine kinase n=1 Tax=Pseudozobellia sp. WGM2 TaxID=2787625 RepID=UPI001ADFBA35|nr:PAS domain S-box protein [Pseudozobellia sp. WGM2]